LESTDHYFPLIFSADIYKQLEASAVLSWPVTTNSFRCYFLLQYFGHQHFVPPPGSKLPDEINRTDITYEAKSLVGCLPYEKKLIKFNSKKMHEEFKTPTFLHIFQSIWWGYKEI